MPQTKNVPDLMQEYIPQDRPAQYRQGVVGDKYISVALVWEERFSATGGNVRIARIIDLID